MRHLRLYLLFLEQLLLYTSYHGEIHHESKFVDLVGHMQINGSPSRRNMFYTRCSNAVERVHYRQDMLNRDKRHTSPQSGVLGQREHATLCSLHTHI